MTIDAAFRSFVPRRVSDTLLAVREEFNTALERDGISDRLARKYHNALWAYQNALLDCPYRPGVLKARPTEHESVMRERVRNELNRVEAEYGRILDSIGGRPLRLTPEPGEE